MVVNPVAISVERRVHRHPLHAQEGGVPVATGVHERNRAFGPEDDVDGQADLVRLVTPPKNVVAVGAAGHRDPRPAAGIQHHLSDPELLRQHRKAGAQQRAQQEDKTAGLAPLQAPAPGGRGPGCLLES